ncbi:PREDICTED: uncharacterized protein LOC109217963 [Nicotiana attenuata]|uniref:uncharacterized protein LOC109217963 n=1 Tax=Nicotiana attenuata TaxID=49451 RepID=UPI00090512C1|nr:PREDICTED: uncharacterized protein LOC109217963 [Nicotiana attenuata]
MLNVVLDFFGGCSMPKYMTSACLVLLPKVEFPNSLTEFRPINLSNFINKIISKVICSRLAPILPRIISANQFGFVKGRNISKNIMLAQEIVHGIKKPNEGSNIVIKLDMAKAYDRVSRSYTCIMLRRMGFCEMVIDMIWRTMSNNWYSVIVNGTRSSLQRIMWILNNYENTSGQQINRHKSHFMSSPRAFQSTIRRVQSITGFTKKTSPLTYLGCPLYIGRLRISHFNNLTSKIVGRIRDRHGKMLSHGGRATLIKHVLQSMTIHLLSAISPPKTAQKQIEKLAASWQKLCFPVEKGGLGFRTIADICKSMEFKQWWHFRIVQSLWSSFLKAKYCQRSNPISKKWDSGQSQAWKRMMFNKKEAEKNIRWRLHPGNCSFWWDNWLGSGPLEQHRNEGGRPGNVRVCNFWAEGN